VIERKYRKRETEGERRVKKLKHRVDEGSGIQNSEKSRVDRMEEECRVKIDGFRYR
jgi:hypothetical protein